MPRGSRVVRSLIGVGIICIALAPAAARAQATDTSRVVEGRVLLASTGAPLAAASVTIEGTQLSTLSDREGRYRLVAVPAGPQVLLVRRIGYAVARVPINVPVSGRLSLDVRMAHSALNLPELVVTADVSGRAKGELGTATVLNKDAIQNQTASSLSGVLELVPGVPLAPPGLNGVQQFSLRAVPTSVTSGFTAGGPSASDIGSLGTLIMLNGVPVSNNANLQTTGPRGELQNQLATTSGGGVDLRQIPASTLQRVEVIRGIPSARYGDLTEGVIVVNTQAGVVVPRINVKSDARTIEASMVGGRTIGGPHVATATLDVARTQLTPGLGSAEATRLTASLEHRVSARDSSFTLDTRLDFNQNIQDNPEQVKIAPGVSSSNHDRGIRAQTQARLALGARGSLTLTASVDNTRRQSTAQSVLFRGALPFTDRLTEGQQTGYFIGGPYPARLDLNGNEWNLYDRLEVAVPGNGLGFFHQFRAGLELRREWNNGPGYQFDIQAPPQVSFNGVEGYDRPRSFDSIPAMATTAAYVDDQLFRPLGRNASLEVQAGLRLDALSSGQLWTDGVRDAALQPRLNVQLSPWPWLRLRGGWGLTAKTPTLADLYPANQYFDVVNVNWYANDPAERLAVLTTFIRDPTNPNLGFSIGHKAEVGFELASRRGGAALAVTLYHDKTTGAVGFLNQPSYLIREHYALSDSSAGTGVPPSIILPAAYTDTVPILIQRPSNILTLDNKGIEATLSLPEFRPLGLRLQVQGAWVKTQFFQNGPDFGQGFSAFQLNDKVARAPYWNSLANTGQRAIVTYRLVHHEPRFGLVVTVVVEHIMKEVVQDVGGTDTLSFEGYITRDGTLVPVPADQRGDPKYADLHVSRTGLLTQPTVTPADWLASLQVSKTLPLGGELRFYAFNALDRLGRFDVAGQFNRQWPPMRFGLEATLPLDALLPPESWH